MLLSFSQRIKDWAVKMRKPEVPYSTIEECARHADIIGVRALGYAVSHHHWAEL
jgi:hypothetical protein